MQNYIGCICLSYLLCVFSNVSSTHKDQSRYIHTGWIGLTFLHCVFSNVSTNGLPDRLHGYTGNICLTFSTVYFQMCPQIACPRGCKVTLVAFVRLFSTVHFQMSLVYCLCQTETMRIANQKRWQMKVKVWSTCKFCPLKFQIIIPPKSLFFRPTKIFVLPRQNQSIPSNSIFPHFRIWRNHPPTFRKKSWKLGE